MNWRMYFLKRRNGCETYSEGNVPWLFFVGDPIERVRKHEELSFLNLLCVLVRSTSKFFVCSIVLGLYAFRGHECLFNIGLSILILSSLSAPSFLHILLEASPTSSDTLPEEPSSLFFFFLHIVAIGVASAPIPWTCFRRFRST